MGSPNGILLIRVCLISIITLILFTSSLSISIDGNDVLDEDFRDSENTRSSYVDHDPIFINGNWDFTLENGVVGGFGTESDPYVISSWKINSVGTNCIEIMNTDKYFSIDNCSLSGYGTYDRAIKINKVENMVISNNIIENIYRGIEIKYVTDTSIKNNSIYSVISGITTIISDVIIKNNTIEKTITPINIQHSDHISICNNIINNSKEPIIFNWVQELIFCNNTLIKSGIWFSTIHWNIMPFISDNIVNDRPLYYIQNDDNFTAPANGSQYVIYNCSDFNIKDLNIRDIAISIQIINSNKGKISACHISDCTFFGIGLKNSFDIDLLNNLVQNSTSGIYLNESMNNMIRYNVIENSGTAIHADNDIGDKIYYNSISKCDNGISIKGTNCEVYENNMINVDKEAEDIYSGNYWNSTDFGNYWSKYTGSDNGEGGRKVGDGIGDTDIPYLGLDHYPYMNPIRFIYPETPMFTDLPDIIGTEGHDITWNTEYLMDSFIFEIDDDDEFIDPIIEYSGPNKFHETVLPEGEYFVRIRSVYMGMESQWSNTIKLVVDDPPEISAGLNASSIYHDSINLTWDPQADIFPLTYVLEISEDDDGPFVELLGINQTRSWHIVTDLKEVTTYYFRMKVVDIHGLESPFSEIFHFTTIMDQHPPSLNTTVYRIEILEDTPFKSVMNLNDVFTDRNGDILTFSVNDTSENITVTINENGTFDIIPLSDWHGEETVTFHANDSIFSTPWNVLILFLSVNDAPYGAEITAESSYMEGEEQIANAACFDVDIQDGDQLIYHWSSNMFGEIGWGLSINLSLPPGNHLVTLNVTDKEGLSNTTTKIIRIESKEGPKPINNVSVKEFPYIPVIIGVIVIIIVILVLFFIIRSRKGSEPEPEPEDSVIDEILGDEVVQQEESEPMEQEEILPDDFFAHPEEDSVQIPQDDLFSDFSLPSDTNEGSIGVPVVDEVIGPDGSFVEDNPDSVGDPDQ